MKKITAFFASPVTHFVVGFLAILALTYSNFSNGMSEEFIVLKAVGMLLWIVSLSLYRFHIEKVIEKINQSQTRVLSLCFGLVFVSGMFFLNWKPGRYERNGLFIYLIFLILVSCIQYGQLRRQIDKQAEKPEQ